MKQLSYRVAKAFRNYRRPLWLLAQRALRRRVVTVEDAATGLRFRCLRDADRMFGETFHAKVYDVPFAPVNRGDVVVDVGANHGFASCYFAARGARVVALEPDPEVFSLLAANVRANGLEEQVTLLPRALGPVAGRAELLVSRRLGGGCSTLDPEFARALALPIQRTVEVETVDLHGLLGGLGIERVRLLKLDCEGSELAVLRSLDPATREVFDSLAIEYHPEAYPLDELFSTLLSWPDAHLSKVHTTDVSNANLHLVRARAIRQWVEA